jgi:hypothetical protein
LVGAADIPLDRNDHPTRYQKMAEAKQAPQFAIVDAAYKSGKEGPRLNIFEGTLMSMNVGQAFDIPTITNGKGKVVPKYGFNVRLANKTYHPRVYRKQRVRDAEGKDVLRVFRVADATGPYVEPKKKAKKG